MTARSTLGGMEILGNWVEGAARGAMFPMKWTGYEIRRCAKSSVGHSSHWR